MSILKKPYEVSVWLDVWDNSTNSFTEEQIAIIGSDTMTSQYRVLEPKLKRNVNGSNELTFKMHRRYKDSATGEQITNPFIDLIANETKLKLKHDGKWYDFLVKNIQQDSNNATYTYSATDLHITELSKNGYGLVLDTTLMNNMGTVNELAGKILKDTGWSLAGELHLDEMIEEQLVEMVTSSGLQVHVPYSSLKNKPEKFQYFISLGTRDEYGVYSGDQTSVDVDETNPYTTDERAIKFGFYYPTGWKFVQITPKRAHCKVFTHKSVFNPALNKIVYYYNNETVAGYSETEYITPNLISNLITNNTFKSTTGWTGSYSGGEANQGADLNAEIKSSTLPRDLLTDMKEGNYDPDLTYTPCLRIKLKDSTSIVVNSGPYDNRTSIKEYSAGQKFVLFYKETTGADFTAKIGARNYSPESGQYNTVFDKLLITFSSKEAENYITDADTSEFAGYRYIVAEVNDGIKLTQKETQKLKVQLFLSGAGGAEYSFSDFQLFPFVPETEGSSVPMLPVNVATEAKAVTKYYYYNVAENPAVAGAEGYVASAQEYKYLTISDTPVKDYKAVYSSEKIRSIDVKQSNYFNAIQSLCETFECWSTFVIGHTDAGKITSKSVVLSQYIDGPNHAGFRYGVNLKNSKRTIDSKQVVTKLIVPDSVNEHAPNGFCSIARAGANPSGENYIYNFQYYINMGLLNADTVDEILYNPDGNYGEISGYYTKLLEINQQLTNLTDEYTSKSLSLMQAHADLQVAENGRIASEEKYQDAADSFAKNTGYDFQDLNDVEAATTAERDAEIARRKEQIEKDTNLQGFLTTVAEYYSAWQKYCAEEADAKNLYDTYKAQSDELYQQIEKYNKQKTELNKAFFAVFYRFIQEGTWKGDEYTDHEKYYFDAKTTSDNSCMPKVTYSFSVLDLSGIKDSETWTDVKGYEALNFNLADKTWVEDPEIFGDAREEVVITEITYVLDEPDKNTIKVQNYKDQFADLFQKQTATVQQVQFAKGAWSKSTKFTEDQPAGQAAFLQNALANAELILQNAGEQSVVWDKNGITVTDVDTPSQQLRIVGGAIMMRDEDDDGLGWKVGITSKGINAKLITAGQVNTGLIQIMNGEEPYFRWDAYGITAYYFDTANSGKGSYNYGLNTRRGVRFDRLGIYGYRNPADKETGKLLDGATWHPKSPEEVQQYAQFALTWDGLYLNLGHATYSDYYYYNESTGLIEPGVLASPIWHAGTAQIGKTSKYLFNKWVTDRNSPYYGLPYYDKLATDEKIFAKIFAVGGADGNDELAIYDDGTLVARRIKLTGSIEWTKNSSPSKSVYGKVELTEPPADNTPYINIPERDGNGTEANPYVWHQIADITDTVYAHTDNGGATWEGPFLITGRSIEYTIVQYCMADRGTDPKSLDDTAWSEFFPAELIDGKCVFTRAADKYNNGQQSAWRYSVGYIGTSNYRIVLDNDYASIPVKNQVNPKPGEENIHDIVDNAWSTSTTARVYYGDEPDTRTWIFSAIDSQASNGLTGVVSYNTITIRPQTAGKLANEDHVVGIQAYNADSDTTLYTSFTAAKLHAGDDAIGYKVVGYPTALVRHHGTENAFTPEKFKLQALKKIGTSQFEDCIGYWKYSVNNDENELFLNEGEAVSEITIQPDVLLGEIDKSTLKSLDVYFYLNSTDKVPADKEIITVAEDGKDGVSIKGIDELYYASASDNIEDIPEIDILNADGTENLEAQWKREISETGYSEELCFLWNAEKMLLSEDGTQNDFSTPALIAAWGAPGAEGRGLDTIISYYFVNQSTTEPPAEQPSISPDDVTVIIVPDGWMTSTTDFPFKAGDCLWEKSFYKYTYALEDGNIYQPAEVSIVRAIPREIYRIALTNDSGVVVTDKDGNGGAFGDNVKTTVLVYKGDEDDTANWTITGASEDLVFTSENGEYQVTGFVADQQVDPDNGYLILTASQKGKSNLSTTFKVSKLKQGEPGADAVAYWLTCSSATIAVNDKGEFKTQNIVFEGKQQVGTADPQNYTPTKFEIYVDGVLTETLTNVSQVTCTLGDDKYKVSSSLSCKMYLNSVVIDTQTAEVVRDGVSLSKLEVLNWYLATDASSGVTVGTEGWTLEIGNAQITESKRYLWNYESVTSYREDGSVISATQSEPSVIGVYGQTGPTGVSISSIKDYYGVSALKTEIPVVWYNSQEQNNDAMPEPTPETPYLWTYEKFIYSDGTVVESSKRIISELSISIKAIKDWFMATATEAEKPVAPTEFSEDGTPTGWTTLDACGHGDDKPYLWTVEILDYNYGKDKQVTEVTLVTRVARSIKDFHEYYCITTTPTAPAAITTGTNGNLITLPEDTAWVLADDNYVPTIEQGEWLWNQEVVEYTTKDNEGKNKYSATSVQLMGYIGTSPYLINLSSDFATIPYTYDNIITEAVFGDIDFSYQVFNGAKELSLGTDFVFKGYFDENAPENEGKDKTSLLDGEEDKLQVIAVIRNATAQKPENGTEKDVDIYFNPDVYTAEWARGTIAIELYGDSVLMATATYELAKQSGGVDGSYEYLVTSSPIIKKLTSASGVISYEPNTITLTLLKRVGDNDPVTSTATRWAKTYIDGELATEKQSFQGSLAVGGEITTEVKVEVFADEACTNIIDREIVPVIADGVDATTYVLAASPNSWNNTDNTPTSVSFTVTKYSGDTPAKITSGYTIKRDDGSVVTEGSETISTTTIYNLFIDGIDDMVDSVTVTAVENGEIGPEGPKPPVTSTVTLYGYGSSYTTVLAEILSSDDYWSTSELYVNSTRKFIFTFSADKTVTYSSNTDTTGTTTYTNQRGLTLVKAYLQGYVDNSDGTVFDDEKARQYAEYLKATNNGALKGAQQVGDALYFNADYINTGTLTVTEGTNVIFSASMKQGEGEVSIAGWTVDNNSIRIGTLGNSGSMWLCRGGTSTSATIGGSDSISGWSLAIGSTFGVTSAGALYASSLKANGGTIAGWTISNQYGIHASYKVAMVNPSTTDEGLKRTSPIDSTSKTMVFYAHTEDPDGDAGYPNFCVLEDGAMYASYGKIGNWKLSTTGLSYGTGIGYTSSFMLTPSGTYYSAAIAGGSKLTWAMTVGSTFGVTTAGALYATGANITGTITATAGTVGSATEKLVISGNDLYISASNNSYKSTTYFWYDPNQYLNVTQIDGATGIADNAFYLGRSGLIFKYNQPLTVDSMYDACRLSCNKLVFTGSGGKTPEYYGHSRVSFGSHGILCQGYEASNTSLINSADGNDLGQVGVYWYGSGSSGSPRLQFQSMRGGYVRFGGGASSSNSSPTMSMYTDLNIETEVKFLFGGTSSDSSNVPYIYGSGARKSVKVSTILKQRLTYELGTPATSKSTYTAYYTFSGESTVREYTFTFEVGDSYKSVNLSKDIGSWGVSKSNMVSTYNVASTDSAEKAAYLVGTWWGTSGYAITSDRRAKYDIVDLNEKKEILFDNLKARGFKYIEGSRGREHLGFILDELEQAMVIAGIASEDFAAYCLPEDGRYGGIRYGEFIALNTWQIQKLKPRMTAAEQEIASLKLEIQQLRTELEALK